MPAGILTMLRRASATILLSSAASARMRIMPTIDKRYLAKILLIVLLFGGGLFGIHAWQARRIPAALLRQADRAVAANNPDSAIRHLRQYLEFTPDDVAVEVQLADLIRLRSGDHARNELHFLYDKILRSDPSKTLIRKEALGLALRTGRLGDAVTHAEAILKATPNDAITWQHLAAAQAGLRLYDAAKLSYETAIKHDPQDVVAWQRLAQFLAADVKKPAEAKKVVDDMVTTLPKNPQAWLTRARLRQMTDEGKPLPERTADTMIHDLTRVLELAPKQPEALLLMAERLQRHRDIAGARATLALGVAAYPGDQRLVRSLAWLEVNRNNMAGAVGVLEDALPHAKDGLELMVPLADLLLDTGDIAKAEAILKSLDRRTGPSVVMQGKYLRARLAMKAAKWDDAIANLSALRSEAVHLPSLETQANMLLATCFQKKGEPEKAIDSLKLITAKDGANYAAHVALGQLYLTAGRTADAVKEYEAAVASPYALPAAFTTYIRMQALKLAHSDGKPNDWAALEKKLNDLAPRYGQLSAEPARLKAEMLMLAGNPKAGVDVLRKELNRKPQSVALWCSLASAVADTDSIAAGLAVLDEAMGFVSDGAELRLARANLYANDPAKLRPLELLESNTENWSDAEQLTFAQGMIEIYDRVGKPAPHLWQKILARRPNDVETWLAACWSITTKDYDHRLQICNSAMNVIAKQDPALAESYKTIYVIDLESTSNNGCGIRDVVKLNMQQLDMMKNRLGNSPTRYDLCLFLGMMNIECGNHDDGHRLLYKAFQLEPNRFETRSIFLYSLLKRGLMKEVKQQIYTMASDPRWSGMPLRRVLGDTFNLTSGMDTHVEQLFTMAKPIIEKQSGGLRWLGEMYVANRKPELARPILEAALLQPTVTLDDYLSFVMTSADPLKAEMFAHAKLNESQFAILTAHLQAADVVLDKSTIEVSPASKLAGLKALLSIYQARMDRDGAIKLLEDVLKFNDLPAKDTAWATRNLAMLLVVRGEVADRDRAAKLLTDTALAVAGESLDDQRTTAGVLAGLQKYLDGPARDTAAKKAVELMEAVARVSNSPKDTFTLCRFYTTAGRPDAAVEKLKGLLASDPGNIDYLLAGLDVLMDAKQYQPARGFADRLVQLAPNEFRVIAAVSRFEILDGKYATGLNLAESYLRSADPLVGDVTSKTAKTAELLEDLARLPSLKGSDTAQQIADLAVKHYESLLPGRAESVIRIAALMASKYDTATALTQIEKHARIVPPRILSTAGVTALGVAGGNDAQFVKVKQWIDAAKKDEPGAMPVLLGEAEWLTLKGDYAAAEVAYEAILQTNPRNVAALNNLAWILAAKPEASTKAMALIDRAVKEAGLTGELLDTRSRIRLAAKQPELAVKDAGEALKHSKTPLRYFHLALAFNDSAPEHREQAAKLFKEAKSRGLTERQIHPADKAAFEALQKGQ